MAARISEEESQQLLQSVEMFEAIAESQPDDYQSLEILKEAYAKLGRKEQHLSACKRLAKAYIGVGQVSQAILEYEGIAQEYPDDPEVKAALAEFESKTTPDETTSIFVAPPLAEHSKPTPIAGGPAGVPSSILARPEDGDRALINVLTMERIVTLPAVDPLLARLRTLRHAKADKTQPMSLLPLLAAEQLARMDDLMTLLVEKSRMPYIPLNIYDADRDCVRRLPEDICWQHCLVPFDAISRSLLVATANPFDVLLRKQVEAFVKCHVFWYISEPVEIAAAFARAYGLDPKRPQQQTKS